MLPHANTAAWCSLIVLGLTFPLTAQESSLEPDASAPSGSSQDDRAIAYFETHIRPLFAQRCYQCHSERADQREGGLLLDRRSGWCEGCQRTIEEIAGVHLQTRLGGKHFQQPA